MLWCCKKTLLKLFSLKKKKKKSIAVNFLSEGFQINDYYSFLRRRVFYFYFSFGHAGELIKFTLNIQA